MRICVKSRLGCARVGAIVGAAACSGPASDADAPHAIDANAAAADARPPRALPVPASSDELCKLFSNANTSDPTPNAVQFRANVRGADLGIPVVSGDRLYLLFGDTIGFAGIWGPGESHPDAIGY